MKAAVQRFPVEVESQPLLGSNAEEPSRRPMWLNEGPVALIVVSFLWGTYTPLLRFLYDIPGAPTPAMLTVLRGVIGSFALGLTSFLWVEEPSRLSRINLGRRKDSMVGRQLESIAEELELEALAAQESQVEAAEPREGLPGLTWLQDMLRTTSDKLWVAGAEMGFWNFMGTALQAIGLEYTTATRAAFIIQSTAIFTPLVSSLAGEQITSAVRNGCVAAMLGTLLVTSEHRDPISDALGYGSLVGDSCVLASALFYACTTVRLGLYANRFPAVQLAAAKTVVLCLISFVWLAGEVAEVVSAGASPAEALLSRWENFAHPTSGALIVFSALGPGALATFLQTFGQATTSPSQAQIIYSSVPLWSALLAVVMLNERGMGPVGWAGGLLIVAGGYFAANSNSQ